VDLAAAVEKPDWYALRWNLETYHKVLKSDCQAEQARLRTAERLTNLLAVLRVVGWRVFWLAMVSLATPDAPAESVLTKPEIELLDRLAAREAGRHAADPEAVGQPLTRADREIGWLLGPCERSASRQHGALARTHPAHRHASRLRIAE
jgi:hypothetical protein